MVERVKRYPNLSLQEKVDRSPLAVLRHIRPYVSRTMEVNSENFPGIFENRPDLRTLYNSTRKDEINALYAFIYSSNPISFASLVGLKQPIDLDVLLFLQKTTLYLSRGIKPVKKYPMLEWYETHHSYRLQFFNHEETQIDNRWSYPNGRIDFGIHTYLALQLALGNQPVTNLAELQAYSKKLNLDLDVGSLLIGFSNMFNKKNVDRFIREGILDSAHLDEFYKRVAEWQLDLSEARSSQTNSLIEPFPISLEPDNYPPIEFLPYIVENYLMSIAELPLYFVKPQPIDLSIIYGLIAHLYSLPDRLGKREGFIDQLVTYWGTHITPGTDLAVKLQAVKQSCNELYPYFELLMKFYRINPQLLYRTQSGEESGSQIKSLGDMYESIQKAGGRVSKRGLRAKLARFNEQIY